MTKPDLYGMPETNASKLQGDNEVLRAENGRLREAMRVAKELIGTLNDIAPASLKASNINQAWHVLNDNLAGELHRLRVENVRLTQELNATKLALKAAMAEAQQTGG